MDYGVRSDIVLDLKDKNIINSKVYQQNKRVTSSKYQ